jgi:UDPglucose 6-dehydrogenase
MREAPSLKIISKLIGAGAKVQAYDPVAMDEAKKHFGKEISFHEDEYSALKNADCLAVVTEWAEFKYPNFNQIKQALKQPIIFDGRNIFNQEDVENHGFEYHSIGCKTRQKISTQQ